MTIHAAKPATSPRLQRVLAVLKDGKPHSSMAIMLQADTVAPSTCVAELRANGAVISCEQRNKNGQRRWYFTMTKGPDNA